MLIVCLLVAVGYIVIVAWPDGVLKALPWLPWDRYQLQFGAISAVVLIAFLAIMFIGAWIGWTMATTPPPKPIEELEAEIEKEEAKDEEKVEELLGKSETVQETSAEKEPRKRVRSKKE